MLADARQSKLAAQRGTALAPAVLRGRIAHRSVGYGPPASVAQILAHADHHPSIHTPYRVRGAESMPPKAGYVALAARDEAQQSPAAFAGSCSTPAPRGGRTRDGIGASNAQLQQQQQEQQPAYQPLQAVAAVTQQSSRHRRSRSLAWLPLQELREQAPNE